MVRWVFMPCTELHVDGCKHSVGYIGLSLHVYLSLQAVSIYGSTVSFCRNDDVLCSALPHCQSFQ